MPGVKVQIGTRPGAADLGSAPGAAFGVAGLTERGPATGPAVKVRTLAEYVAVFGQRVTYGNLYDALEAYFAEGGTEAYVARVVGPAATAATLTLVDQSGGAGVASVRVDAASPGAWGTTVSVQVDAGSAAGSWKLTVLESGVAQEVYNNLLDVANAVAYVNARSTRVVLTDLASPSVAPTNQPKVLVATALAGAPTDDRVSVTAAMVAAAFDARFPAGLGGMMIATPGYDAATVGPALIAHALTKNRLAALAPPAASSAAGARAAIAALRVLPGAEGSGLFYPWVQVPNGAGGVRTISPEGTVAGLRARAQVAEGPWRAPAGDIGQSRHIVGLETELDSATADGLDDDGVSCFRRVAGTLRLYGWRSLSTDEANYRFLTARDVLTFIAALGGAALERITFRTIDARGQLFSEAATELRDILEPIRSAGGLFERVVNGQQVDPGYRIDTSTNTVATEQRGEVHVNVAARVSPVGALVILTVAKVPLANAL